MKLLQFLFIFILNGILNGRTTQSELRIETNTPGGPAELEDAAIQVLTTCYANQTTTIALVGDYSSSFVKRLSSHESFALVSLHDIMRSENAIPNLYAVDQNRKHKVDILVAIVPYHDRFGRVLWNFWLSLYDNPMALTLLLVWSPQEKNAGCDAKYKTATFFYYSNLKNHLNTILMCHHRTDEIMMYTTNPFKNQASEPWQSFPVGKIISGPNFFYFARKYRVNKEMCKNLEFDKTRDLNGWTIKVAWPIKVVVRNNEIKPLWWSARGIRIEQQRTFGIINRFISYVNASMIIRDWKISKIWPDQWDKYKVSVYAIRGVQTWQYHHTYPAAQVPTFLITQFRGNKSQLRKILDVIDGYSWIGMSLVYLITLLFFKYFLREPLLVGILDLCRLTCNCGLTTLPRNGAPQIYLSCVLFFIVTMQGIFTGNLASLLTHDFPVRQVNSIQDVIDLNYTVYCESTDNILFADPRFKGRIVTINRFDDECLEQVKLDARSVCVAATPFEKHRALELELYIGTEDIDTDWACNIVPWRWSLLERFNEFQGHLNDAGAAVPFETMVDQKRLRELEAVEVALEPEVMIWEDLRFAFVILAIGLVCATITLIVEITIHWYYRRVTTTRVIVL